MSVGIALTNERRGSAHVVPFHYVYSRDMPSALRNAVRYCALVTLSGEGPDATVYAYDCLGGLRFEARRRDNKFTLKRT